MLLGRDAERAAIDRLLEGARASAGGALVVRGEAGVGKSALLAYAAGQAGATGLRVLRAVGVESETELPFAGLHQILGAGIPGVERLPAPQAAALRSAFGLSAERVDDRFLISLGALGLLSELAESSPLLVAVDDAQWLDRPSAEALGFAGRRIAAEPVAMLLAARDGEARRLEAPGLPELTLGGLAPEPARALLARRGGQAPAPAVAERLVALTGGNPLALLELPGELRPEQLDGRVALPDHLPLTSGVERAFLGRAGDLPEGARTVLAVAAADEAGDLATVLAAARALGAGAEDLDAAVDSGLVRVMGERVELRHPLARSALARGIPYAVRQAAHRALAEVLDGEANADRRAWHRAATAVAPDDAVADELERSAARAATRSGHAAAATALERAARLSGDEAGRGRRLVAAARAAWEAGRAPLAQALAEEAEPLAGDARQHAELLEVRGLVELSRGRPAEAGHLLTNAADGLADGDPAPALELLLAAADAARAGGDVARLLALSHRAAALGTGAEGIGRHFLVGIGPFLDGDLARGRDELRAAVAGAEGVDDPRLLVWAANAATAIGQDEQAIALQSRAIAAARGRGRLPALAVALGQRGGLLAVHGRLEEALADGEEGVRLAEEAGLENSAAQSRSVLACVAALRGDAATCRAEGERAAALATRRGLAQTATAVGWALAVLDLGLGRCEPALERLHDLATPQPGRWHGALNLYATPDLAEAAARAGRPEAAIAALARFAAWADATGSVWAGALVARSRGLLAGGAAGVALLEEALRLHPAGARPLERARTELCLGEALRRARRPQDARAHLRSALAVLEGLQAEPWAERARAELRATGATAARRDPAAAASLTPQEHRIARFVAEGASNKEVAAQLFLSPRTVEYHLAKVFQKLGVASRTELSGLGVLAGG